jgi:hypothetical protein
MSSHGCLKDTDDLGRILDLSRISKGGEILHDVVRYTWQVFPTHPHGLKALWQAKGCN